MIEAKRRCVIADDVRAWRELLSAWLGECGYDCVLTVDGEAARKAIESASTDLVITDIEMPRCSGLELITQLRRHRIAPIQEVPVIVISSLQDDELSEVVGRFGGDFVFVKPLERSRIQEAVRELEHGRKPRLPRILPEQSRSSSGKTISPKLRRLAEEAALKFATHF